MTSSHCLVRLCLNCCLNGEQSSIDVSVPLPLSSNTWQDNRGLGRELERAVPNPEEFILEQYLPCHSARPPGISHWPAIWPQPYRQWLRGETVVSCVNGGYCCCLYLTRNKKLYSGFYNIVHVMGLDVSVLVVLWFICVWFAERSCYAKVCIWYTFTGPNPDGTAHLWPLAFWVVVLWSNEEKLLVSSFNSQLVKSSSARVSVFFFTNYVFVLHRNWRRPQPMQQKRNADVCRPRTSCRISTGWKWRKKKWYLFSVYTWLVTVWLAFYWLSTHSSMALMSCT